MTSSSRGEVLTSGIYKSYSWQLGTWPKLKDGASFVRNAVFVAEQKIPADLEYDEFDSTGVHILVINTMSQPVGTARLISHQDKVSLIGRVSVIPDVRGQGIGRFMLTELMRFAGQRGDRAITLNAQVHANDFYRKLGYRPEGEIFMEAGIPHVRMMADLSECLFSQRT